LWMYHYDENWNQLLVCGNSVLSLKVHLRTGKCIYVRFIANWLTVLYKHKIHRQHCRNLKSGTRMLTFHPPVTRRDDLRLGIT
jgi:hypothetical protein